MKSISRRSFLKTAGFGAAAIAAGQFPIFGRAASSALQNTKNEGKPNFVVIFIDDMGYGDVEPFGSKLNCTPNLNKMAAEGMKLTSFYGAPVCTPSRAQIMTGCYAKRVSLPNVIPPACPIGISDKELTVAQLLKTRGYATMCIGKWHLGDQPEFLPTRHGFDHYIGLPYSNDMGSNKDRPRRPPLPLLYDETVKKVIEPEPEQDKLTELYTDEAVKFITANKNNPFFLYLPHTAVHVPIRPGKAFQGKSANGRYGDWVEEIDWSVGRIINTLKELKLDSRTLVLFTSDNGPWLRKGKDSGVAAPLNGGKGSTWEGGMREPTIAWWPGKIAAGSVCDAVTSGMDVLPTLVKLAGGAVPADRLIDGRDIWPLLSGQTKESPHDALFYFNGQQLEAVRCGPWKLAIVYQSKGMGMDREPDTDKKKPFVPKLFNLETDIGETTDVAGQHPDVVKRLQALIAKMGEDIGVNGSNHPGIRPCGHVENPKPLLLKVAMEYD